MYVLKFKYDCVYNEYEIQMNNIFWVVTRLIGYMY